MASCSRSFSATKGSAAHSTLSYGIDDPQLEHSRDRTGLASFECSLSVIEAAGRPCGGTFTDTDVCTGSCEADACVSGGTSAEVVVVTAGTAEGRGVLGGGTGPVSGAMIFTCVWGLLN